MVDRLEPSAWVIRAFAVLAERGVDGVRVEALARDLEVTKGSFYWHFKDRRALLDAMLDEWRRVATDEVIDRVEAKGGGPADKLRFLVRICSTGQGDRVEAAMRSWALNDERARSTVAAVDEAREAYVTELLVGVGFGRAEARRRARVLYLLLVGMFTWTAHDGAPGPRGLNETVASMVLGERA